jgi:hypothetical protein
VYPPVVAEAPFPVPETLPDYPPGVERPCCAIAKPRLAKPSVQVPPRKKKQELPADWHAKRWMIILCILLLIANLCVGTYLMLTWDKRAKRPPEPTPIQPPEKPKKSLPPPPRLPIDIGMGRHPSVADG